MNPAHNLYQIWDGLFRFTVGEHIIRYLTNQRLAKVDTSSKTWLNDVPLSAPPYYSATQMIDVGTVIYPIAVTQDDRFIYAIAWNRSYHGRKTIFQLSPDGQFRLGEAFNWGSATRGVYDRVEKHTFLGWSRLYGRDRSLAWFYSGPDDGGYVNPRDWRTHRYYWRDKTINSLTWLELQPLGNTWQARVAEDDMQDRKRLLDEYQEAEQFYAKWRRRYFKSEGIHDPQRQLDRTDIETVDYLTQHLNVYEPPKARMPA